MIKLRKENNDIICEPSWSEFDVRMKEPKILDIVLDKMTLLQHQHTLTKPQQDCLIKN